MANLTNSVIEGKLIASGIYPNLNGFRYIVDAVANYGSETPAGEMYSGVAKMNKTTPERVERSIRHARSKTEKSKEHTNAEFIALLRWEIERESEQKNVS